MTTPTQFPSTRLRRLRRDDFTRHLKHFESGQAAYSHVWYRWFNEAPVLLMVAAVLLVVLKPF